jgi:hypothetical protein
LPAAAGRIWWEYGGTDYLPSGPGGVFPEIAAPASIVGCALLEPRWDLVCEFTELRHETVLWYANGGFPEGYSHDGWLLAHTLGGSGQALAGTVRVRPAGLRLEAGVTLAAATWKMAGAPWGEGRRTSVRATLRRLPAAGQRPFLPWALHGEIRREEAGEPGADLIRRTWGRIWLDVGLP